MTTLHQVLLPGEADGGDSPRLSITDDTHYLITNNSRRQSPVSAREPTMARPESTTNERCVAMNELHAEESDQSSPREHSVETSSPPQQARTSADDLGIDKNANMQRVGTAGTKARIPSETGSEAFSGHNGIRVEIKSNWDEKPILDDENDKSRRISPVCRSNVARSIGKLVACFLCGIIFGIAAEKGRGFNKLRLISEECKEKWGKTRHIFGSEREFMSLL
nr:uncharacterized protein LOC129269636 [Lytechinus pictus]